MQLVAYGAQDIYLTGNPQITYFKVVYRRHTNFSMESISQPFTGTADFGNTATTIISRSGDLMYRTYISCKTPTFTPTTNKNFRWLNWLGHILVENVVLEIGGQQIDKQYGEWFHIWNELTQKAGQQSNYANMVGNVPKLVQPSTAVIPEIELYIPLQFYFCRNPGLALPLIALQYHEVKIIVKFASKNKCYWSENGTAEGTAKVTSLTDCQLYVDYIFLDTEERRRFAQASHEYLIEQLQFNGGESVTTASQNIQLNFNHPCKELVWVVQKDAHVDNSHMGEIGGLQHFNFTDRVDTTYFSGTPSHEFGNGIGTSSHSGVNPFLSMPFEHGITADKTVNGKTDMSVPNVGANEGSTGDNDVDLPNISFSKLLGADNSDLDEKEGFAANLHFFPSGKNPVSTGVLKLNNQERFSTRTGRYFNTVQPYQHHTNGPAPGINVYSFALSPEEHQPSGTCNFSRIDKAVLSLELTANTIKDETGAGSDTSAKVKIYATNYNVLRIMSGMGGLAYAN